MMFMSRIIRKNWIEVGFLVFILIYSITLFYGINPNVDFIEVVNTNFANPFTILIFTLYGCILMVQAIKPLNNENEFVRYQKTSVLIRKIFIKQLISLILAGITFYLPMIILLGKDLVDYSSILVLEYFIYFGLIYSLSIMVLVLDLFVKKILFSVMVIVLLPIISIFFFSGFNILIQDYFVFPFLQSSVLLNIGFIVIIVLFVLFMKQLVDYLYYKRDYILKRGD